LDDERYGYGLDANGRLSNGLNGAAGSTALYHHNGSRYGLSLAGRVTSADAKMNGLHGPKHKRGDVDRTYFVRLLITLISCHIQSTGLLALGLRIYKAKLQAFVRINTVADICRRSSKKVYQNTVTSFSEKHSVTSPT
jgi:hypothetical protein